MPRHFLAIPVVLFFAAGAAFYFLSGSGDKNAGDDLRPSAMTVEQLYQEVDRRLAAAGGVTHQRSDSSFRSFYNTDLTTETWLDPSSSSVRQELEVEVEGRTITSKQLTTPEELFYVDDRDSRVTASRFVLCYGVGAAASVLLGCPEQGSETVQRVEQGTHNGREVVVLVDEGKKLSGERRISFTSFTYLDARTLMPVEFRSEGLFIGRTPVPFVSSTEYEEPQVVARGSLASDFFTPAGIGYTAPDPMAALKSTTGIQLYWPGQELTLPDGRVIFLQSSYGASGPGGGPYRVSLQYATKDRPHEPPFITLQVFDRERWERSPAIQAQAVTFGDVVVFVNAQAFPDQKSLVAPPNSYEYVLSQLRPYP